MPTPENPFDQTIWDPFDPEYAIEDTMHGSGAVIDMLQIPAMPYGNGTYYQFGGYYAFGTNTVDANGQPVYEIRLPSLGTLQLEREIQAQTEWLDVFHRDGDAGHARLEAERQQQRLKKNGFTQAFKDSDVCGGGKRLDDCESAIEMRAVAQDYVDKQTTEKLDEGTIMSELSWLSRKCGSCALNCSVAVQTDDGRPTGIKRITNTKSFEADLSDQ
jgi:hypothetical protein